MSTNRKLAAAHHLKESGPSKIVGKFLLSERHTMPPKAKALIEGQPIPSQFTNQPDLPAMSLLEFERWLATQGTVVGQPGVSTGGMFRGNVRLKGGELQLITYWPSSGKIERD